MWMDLEIIILSEVSLTKKDRYYMALLINGVKEKRRQSLWETLPKGVWI